MPVVDLLLVEEVVLVASLLVDEVVDSLLVDEVVDSVPVEEMVEDEELVVLLF